GPLFQHPTGYTRHVRDPKVWYDESDQLWYLIVGAQTLQEEGTALVYRSPDLAEWTLQGELLRAPEIKKLQQRGYMWECPDLIYLDGHWIFLYSPQGIEEVDNRYRNIFQSVYVTLKKEEDSFILENEEMKEIDWGFEF